MAVAARNRGKEGDLTNRAAAIVVSINEGVAAVDWNESESLKREQRILLLQYFGGVIKLVVVSKLVK